MSNFSFLDDVASMLQENFGPIKDPGYISERSTYVVGLYAYAKSICRELLAGMERPTFQGFFGPGSRFGVAVESISSSRMLNTYEPRTLVFLGILLLFPMTYLTTSFTSTMTVHKKGSAKEPPTVPFWIPVLGNIIPFLMDGAAFASSITTRFGYSIPVRMQLGPFSVYLVSGSDHIKSIFKTPHGLGTPALLIAVRDILGTPKHVVPFYAADNSGVSARPQPGSNVPPERRILYIQHKVAHKYLTGQELKGISERYMKILQRNLSIGIEYDWIDIPDLQAFLQSQLFSAAVESMCGTYIFSLNPTLVEDFWQFDRNVPLLYKGVPQWMYPSAYRAREKMLTSMKKWHKFASEHSDYSKREAGDWDPYWGSNLVKARQEYFHKMGILDADAMASEDLGLLFAGNANSIPVTTWFVLDILSNPSLLRRVRSSVSSALVPTSNNSSQVFDITKLIADPLLQSIYAETLRLRVAVLVARAPIFSDFQLDEWTLRKDHMIGMSSRTAALNSNVWNTGSAADPHPLDTFWADRFLVYPDQPHSGPLRDGGSHNRYITHGTAEPQQPTQVASDGSANLKPRYSLDGLTGAWIPYGGGDRMCPGRHFAKQEIIGTFALLAEMFDIELAPSKRLPEMDMRYFPLGGLPLKRPVGLRIKRRWECRI